jgi:hypothetical protein
MNSRVWIEESDSLADELLSDAAFVAVTCGNLCVVGIGEANLIEVAWFGFSYSSR